ncbi:ABC-three component system middle component 2 [Rhizobium phaseoli]|uniref:ABC-three component system middle component 2 n=1 Tax=Rhizobium phaseoli TaxID=396 RepID=UPI00143848F1|nr:ABC-three component system middle component 2 [Rhizobium phaseoli]MDK4730602.1 threonine transporter [Rhizobium phaseoli]NKE91848.1 threonine transporter [Rhizobium phaseoli]
MDRLLAPERRKPTTTFNSPLEAGVRAVAILAAAFPRAYDLQRLIAYDHLLVHTGDLPEGPDSLHPPAPMRTAELLVRRGLIERALLLMMTRDLVCRETDETGFRYKAGENAALFFSIIQSEYIIALRSRADWLVERLGDLTDLEFRALMRRYFDDWVEEFQMPEQSSGNNP